jgi:hypothetical protein
LRERWRHDWDVVLIDSRTGLSDTGGICTIQLPDVIVAMFTANHQSLYGVRDVMRLVQGARQALAYDRAQLAIVPLASRFGVRAEFRESQEWLDRIAEAMAEFFLDWLPTWVEHRLVVERMKVPQVDYFGFGEKLAVVEHGTSDPESMGFVYSQVATMLANNLADVEEVLGLEGSSKKRFSPRSDYRYELFVSYAHDPLVEDFLRSFLGLLQPWVSEALGQEARIFADYTELGPGVHWSEAVRDAIAHSKLLLAMVTPRYFASAFTRAEWNAFMVRGQRASMGQQTLVIPVLLRGDLAALPDDARKIEFVDFTDVAFGDWEKPSIHTSRRTQDLAFHIAERLTRVPGFDPKLNRVSPEPPPPLLGLPEL